MLINMLSKYEQKCKICSLGQFQVNLITNLIWQCYFFGLPTFPLQDELQNARNLPWANSPINVNINLLCKCSFWLLACLPLKDGPKMRKICSGPVPHPFYFKFALEMLFLGLACLPPKHGPKMRLGPRQTLQKQWYAQLWPYKNRGTHNIGSMKMLLSRASARHK